MWLVFTAMRRPVTILVAVLAVALTSIMAILRMTVDIFPKLGAPADLRRAAVRRHGPGADGRVPHVLLRVPLPLHHRHRARRVEEHPGRRADEAGVPSRHRHEPGDGARWSATSIARARSCRRAPCRRSSCASTPAACRSASWSSRARRAAPGEMQDIALNRVRPLFATLPGVSAPPPFGGNQRTIVVRLDPGAAAAVSACRPTRSIAAVNRASDRRCRRATCAPAT